MIWQARTDDLPGGVKADEVFWFSFHNHDYLVVWRPPDASPAELFICKGSGPPLRVGSCVGGRIFSAFLFHAPHEQGFQVELIGDQAEVICTTIFSSEAMPSMDPRPRGVIWQPTVRWPQLGVRPCLWIDGALHCEDERPTVENQFAFANLWQTIRNLDFLVTPISPRGARGRTSRFVAPPVPLRIGVIFEYQKDERKRTFLSVRLRSELLEPLPPIRLDWYHSGRPSAQPTPEPFKWSDKGTAEIILRDIQLADTVKVVSASRQPVDFTCKQISLNKGVKDAHPEHQYLPLG